MNFTPVHQDHTFESVVDPWTPSDVAVHRRRDLLASGMTDTEISHHIRDGLLTRIRHGIYADRFALERANEAGTHLAHVRAAVLASTEPAYANGPSAALLYGMSLPWPAPADIHMLRISDQDPRSLRRESRHRLTLPSMTISTHRDAPIGAREIRGIPVVSPAVAAVTSVNHVGFYHRVAMLDAALWTREVDTDQLAALAREWKHLGGLNVILDALEHARFGAQSYLETISRLILVRHGLPEPILQFPLHDSDGLIGFADMYWPTLNVVGEADGAIKYTSRQRLTAEKIREDRIRRTGRPVVRWMTDDILIRPQDVVASIRKAARRAA